MKHLSCSVLFLGLLAMASCRQNDKPAAANANSGTESTVRQRIDQLTKAYSHKDTQAIVALTDPDGSVLFGTDSAEVNVGKEAILQQMKDDFASVDSLQFDAPTNYHGQASPTLATAFFDQPLEAFVGGRRYHSLTRFATAWHKRDDNQWYLTQLLVSRPTKGKSSHEMVAAMHKPKAGAAPANK